MVLGAKAPGAIGVRFDRVGDLELRVIERGLHQKAAPAAQPDDRCVDHLITSDIAGRRLIASIKAALSLSAPSSAMAARKSSAWAVVAATAICGDNILKRT